jgi:hypothetical protein
LFFATRGLPVVLELGLLIFCLIEAIQTPSDEVRNLSKGLWIVLIIFVPLVGGIAWLVAGRPNVRRQPGWRANGGFPEYERPRRPAPVAPDDDPAFLAQLGGLDREREKDLRRWEEDLRRREAELRDGPQNGPQDDPDDASRP